MRAIDYRQYLGERAGWHYWGLLSEDVFVGPANLHDPNSAFIGIHDKNDKKIYEGDVVRQEYANGYWVGVVVWLHTDFHNGWYFRIIEMDYGFVDVSLGLAGRWYNGNLADAKERYKIAVQQDVEVIGNVYENPEMVGR